MTSKSNSKSGLNSIPFSSWAGTPYHCSTSTPPPSAAGISPLEATPLRSPSNHDSGTKLSPPPNPPTAPAPSPFSPPSSPEDAPEPPLPAPPPVTLPDLGKGDATPPSTLLLAFTAAFSEEERRRGRKDDTERCFGRPCTGGCCCCSEALREALEEEVNPDNRCLSPTDLAPGKTAMFVSVFAGSLEEWWCGGGVLMVAA
ncbi:unnamed protein product [Closterium sp. NIES-54]